MEIMESGGELIRDNEERIFVSVRLRPLNKKEISSNDVSDWECINSDTIVYKNGSLLNSERLMYPTAYTFDRVFRSNCSTRTVYEQGAKNVALSVVHGVNSNVFAYGQTSSGKTYTMTGITEYAIADIYDYIQKHPEREFILKFSAMEIYNESVRDLLSVDRTPLRLLDDPERGTIVENLTEEILRDRDHVTELLFICEAQRQTEETSLNEMSSLSHQIIRLTIESSPLGFFGRDNASTLSASVTFVDLAGSEQAFQSLSTETKLKEGCHINHGLLSLGTVIRKLSKERNGNIPYRDSILMQILQTSLGGYARTAIICTMSPARSHVEQSRNTLHFASCAKEVTTNARVNVLMSDKALVKHLQKELARLENELRSSQPNCTSLNCSALLREKDAQIEKLEKEIKDLILQRDIFQSQVQELSRMLGKDASSITQVELGHYPHLRVQKSPDRYIQEQETCTSADPECSDVDTRTCYDELSRSSSQFHSRSSSQCHIAKIPCFDDNFEHSNASPSILPRRSNFSETDSLYGWQEIEKQINGNLEDLYREVNRIETEHSRNRGATEPTYSYSDDNAQFPAIKVHVNGDQQPPLVKDPRFISSSMKDDNEENEDISSGIMPLKEGQELISASVEEGKELTSSMLAKERDFSPIQYPNNVSLQKLSLTHNRAEDSFVSRRLKVPRSKSWYAGIIVTDSAAPWFKMTDYSENTPSVGSEKESERCGMNICTLNFGSDVERLSGKDSQSRLENALDMEIDEIAREFSTAEDGTSSTPDIRVKADLPNEEEITMEQEKEDAPKIIEFPKENVKYVELDPKEDEIRLRSWPVEFKRLQREIIELWHACNISLVHRTYFFLLFQGDPSDAIYLEVEIKRMKMLKDKFSRGDKIIVDGRRLTLSSSAKALRQERRMLSEQMMKKFSEQEREKLFIKWGIGLKTKLRRQQLAHRVWSKTEDINHIADSAILVEKLVGLREPGQTPSREKIGINFTPKSSTGICTFKRSLGLGSLL